MIRRSLVFLCCASVVVLAATDHSGGADEPKRVPVYCPAIGAEDRPRTNAFGEQTGQPTLVVLGTARRVGKDDERALGAPVEIEVEKVLFGSHPETKVRCVAGSGYWPDEKPQRLILALTPQLDSKEYPFEVRYTLPPEEEKPVAALSAARMTYNVFSAETVFVGKEVLASADKGRVIEVRRVLHGPESLKDKRVCVDLLEHPIRRGAAEPTEPLPTVGEHIYFVAGVEPEYKKKGFRAIENPDGPVYLVSYHLPGAVEKTVVDTLKQREQYPLVEIENGGEKVTYREVLFRGSVADAVAFLGSGSEGAVALAGRSLIHRKKEALAPVLAAIRADLFLVERKGGFHQLRNLIQLLPQLDPKKEAVHELVEKWLVRLATKPPEPRALERTSTYYQPEQQHVDVNHSLAWLLEQLDQKTVLERYGKRLLALRDQVSARWKQEVQLALDVAKVEDNFELAAALERLKDVRPVRSKSGLRHPGGRGEGVVAFTPDGKHLATVGGGDLRVWRTGDWTLAVPPTPLTGSIERLVFSPDGKYLYIAGGGGLQIHARYNWKEGRLDRAYVGHKSGVAELLLSADGKTMVTSNYYEETIHVWDTETGQIRRTFKTPNLAYQIALSPDGSTLLRRIALEGGDKEARTAWKVEALAQGALEIPEAVLEDNPALVAFSPDGKYFLAVGRTDGWGGSPTERTVRLHDVRDKFRELDKTTIKSLPPKRVIFDVERGVVLVHGQWSAHDIHALSVPNLKLLKGSEKVQQRCRDPKSVCLSPDGKLLATASLFRPAPQLFRTDTYEEVIPYDGHGDTVSSVFFQPGGKLLRTLGRDNTICTWDARTMKLLKRQSLPPGWNQQSSREPDGRYLISATDGGQEHVLRTFDVEADKVVATVKVPRAMFGFLQLFWLNDREVYAVSTDELCHFDATTGKVIARREFKGGRGRWSGLSGDGKEFVVIGGWIPRSPRVEVERVSVESGKAIPVGGCDLRTFSGNRAGVVPGDKYFYVAEPGMHLFDVRTLKPVWSRDFGWTLSLSFATDGSRYAVATEDGIYADRHLRQWDLQMPGVVRIHDVETGRTLGAFAASTRGVSVKLSPDGKQLAVANDDGTIELWDLSGRLSKE
jgi:WD40 repeat protein